GPGQSNEMQTVTVDATGGSFTLTYPQEAARGTGKVKTDSFVVKVATLDGAFAPGQAVEGDGILPGTTITAVGAGSVPPPPPATKPAPIPGVPLLATGATSSTTADLPASATAAQVQSALNGLATVSSGGGAVSVTGGPGNSGGTTPYLVTFDGGPL